MKYSGLYFVSNPTAQIAGSEALSHSICASIESSFERANREDGGWSLNHRLFRNVQDQSNRNGHPNFPHTYQHFLRLSHLDPSHAYNFIQNPPTPQPATEAQESSSDQPSKIPPTAQPAQGEIVTIPAEQFESLYGLVLNQWTPLWTPQRALDIPSNFPGITYKVATFTIRIGELRARRSGPQTAATLSPGIVVCITTNAGALDGDSNDDGNEAIANLEEELDFTGVQEQIREIWKMTTKNAELGKSEIRETMQAAHDFGGDQRKETDAVVRMWCEALRLRGLHWLALPSDSWDESWIEMFSPKVFGLDEDVFVDNGDGSRDDGERGEFVFAEHGTEA